MTDLTPSSLSPEPQVSRRRLLVAGGVTGLGLLGWSATTARAQTAGISEFNGPGKALQPAERVPPTTTTTTTPPTTTAPLPELEAGEILFPIVVGEDDSCFVGDNFGACRDGCSRSHEGVDIMADQGLPVRAVVSGKLTKIYEDSGSCGGAGNGWTLLDEENDVTYKFFHLDRHEEGLEADDFVEVGQIIGYVGETGTSGVCSDLFSNYHLHFEYRPNNVAADSFPKLNRDPNVDFAS